MYVAYDSDMIKRVGRIRRISGSPFETVRRRNLSSRRVHFYVSRDALKTWPGAVEWACRGNKEPHKEELEGVLIGFHKCRGFVKLLYDYGPPRAGPPP